MVAVGLMVGVVMSMSDALCTKSDSGFKLRSSIMIVFIYMTVFILSCDWNY